MAVMPVMLCSTEWTVGPAGRTGCTSTAVTRTRASGRTGSSIRTNPPCSLWNRVTEPRDGAYVETGRAAGDEELVLTVPFPIAITSSALVTR
ncbi:hypothetical protein GCM10022223_03750 [Kineosporia mesophila]|uniref:Secreted protein n=1 Tax=Kineosporia mesophila TaxID=566012 RepID=A0ABP6YX62_9ACTN